MPLYVHILVHILVHGVTVDGERETYNFPLQDQDTTWPAAYESVRRRSTRGVIYRMRFMYGF